VAIEGGQKQQPGKGRDRGRGRGRGREREREESPFIEKIVKINRVAKVVKGGRRFSFSVYGVVGDGAGRVGVGLGKANLVPDAIRKSIDRAKQSMIDVPVTKKGTIPYKVEGRYGAGRVLLKPAAPGTGIIAGGAVRAVLEALGVRDILTKTIGSNTPSNVLRATMEGLGRLTTAGETARLRGISIREVFHGVGAPESDEGAKTDGS